LSEAARMIFLGSIKIDSLCELSRAQSRSRGLREESFYGPATPPRFHTAKTQSGH
jgi:hypothetical protein